MTWQEIRKQVPNRWLLVEALKAHSGSGRRFVDDFALVGIYDGEKSDSAMDAYLQSHKENPSRELYVMHSSEVDPVILDRRFNGLRIRV